jgi:predicted O-methyltransferase YrrM
MFYSNFRSKTLIQTALWNLREITDYAGLHPGREMRRRALDDSVEYLRSLPVLPPSFPSPRQLLRLALEESHPKGNVVELGVFKGGTIRFIARHLPPDRPIHGFDTFQGLPTRWTGNTDMFQAGGVPPKVPPNVVLHVGLFTDTLPGWLEQHPEPISFLHVDCDLYESTKPALECLAPRIREGTVLVFDEYFNYPGWQAHEFRAFQEFIESYDVKYTYLGYSSAQMAVRIDQIRLLDD